MPTDGGSAGSRRFRASIARNALTRNCAKALLKARFEVYQRQNLADENDFSCGIAYLPHGRPPLTLARYNGPSHPHGEITYLPHIHRASEQAMAAGRRPESEAEETDRFSTLEGALACLVEDFSLTGLDAQPDQPRLL